MRKIILLMGGLFLTSLVSAQVGIETADPQATLDINGDARIVTTPLGTNAAAKDSILAVDGSGFVKRITSEQIYTEIVDKIRNEITASSPKSFVKGNLSTTNSILNISIALGATQRIPFSVEQFDENNDFNTTTNTFTAPEDGIYSFTVQFRVNSLLNVAEMGVAVVKGGSTPTVLARESYTSISVLGINVSPPLRKVTTIAKLNAGEQVYFGFYSSVALTVGLVTSNVDSFFTIHQIK